MRIAKPELKVIRFANEDVIATSMFAVSDGNGGYNVYNGAIVSSSPEANGGWIVDMNTTTLVDSWNQEAYDTNKTDAAYSPFYDAYYESGNYYTNGVAFDVNHLNAGAQDPGNTPPTNPPFSF